MRERKRDKISDSTLSFAWDSCLFITKRCGQHRLDFFHTRFLLPDTICRRGDEAADLFYDEGRFAHTGAVPLRLAKVLFDFGGLQGMDNVSQQDLRISPSHSAPIPNSWFVIRNVRLPSTRGRA